MAARMAQRLYAARAGAITADEFQELFNSTSASGEWSKHGITLRMAALMAATALNLQAALGYAAAVSAAGSPLDPATAQASGHAQRTMEAVEALCGLADQYGGGSPRA
jgi:hypothetical protein